MTDPTLAPLRKRRLATWADSAGVLGAVFAALCCMGVPVILSVLAAVGLSWLRRDAILWPLMLLSLGTALWGLWGDRRRHGMVAPFGLGAAGSVALVAGVIFVHGPPARLLIDGGAVALVAATLWNIWARRTRNFAREVA
jgi:mercuric ion transport protein